MPPDFPYELVTVDTDDALSVWSDLRSAGRGYPVILGPRRPFDLLREWMDNSRVEQPSPAQSLAEAANIRFPDDLLAEREREEGDAPGGLAALLAEHPEFLPEIRFERPDGTVGTLSKEEALAMFLSSPRSPPAGEWPDSPRAMMTWTYNYAPEPDERDVFIGLLPVEDWTTVPALLSFGRWNACPAPAYHVAALRSWRDRFGVELVSLTGDALDVRVARRPADRAAAQALAREHYAYCSDTVIQGFYSMNALAASLTVSDWWNFWWD